jgi:putative DNA primase/helicase
MATLDQVLDQMQAADMPPLPPGHPVLDGKIHRYGGREKKCWYVLFEYPARNGKRYLAGAFGRWSGTDNGKIIVKSDFTGIAPDELARLQRSQAAQEVQEREKRSKVARHAAGRARRQWDAARATLNEGEVVPYLARKRLRWEKGLRVFKDGTLIVPMIRYDITEEMEKDPQYTGPRRMVGLQKILPEKLPGGRDKLFNRGMEKPGAASRFGPKPRDGELFLIGEGLATVLSCLQTIESAYTAWVAFDAGNLMPVARILRALYPNSPFLFLADDDAYLEAMLNKRLRAEYGVDGLYKVLDGSRLLHSRFGPIIVQADFQQDGKGTQLMTVGIRREEQVRTFVINNAGRTKAWDAAAAVGNAWVTWPRFAAREMKIDADAPRITDFNDLHVVEGADKLAEQLGEAVKSIEDAHALARQLAAGTPAGADASGGAAADGGKGSGGDDEPDWALHGSLIRRFTLIERTGTAWDALQGHVWKIEHMRYSYGTRAVNMWLASPRTRKIDVTKVVFDPTSTTDPKTTINLFRGLQTKPSQASCEKLLKLCRYLCGEEEATYTPVSDWVLDWCAYQVQHVGAKMRTAIVMHGPEGSGKNQFWSAMQQIFDPYSAQIGQAELEDKFNGWLSARLFLLANEVVTRAEMSHHVGKLKAYVTEPFLHIRTVYADARYEANHANLVFLSNEFQPLKISPGDRRYMVIRTPPIMPAEFYKDVGAELRAGGAGGFMRFLLERELKDFNEHTKPLLTDAKRDLIEVGMLPSQAFWQEIKDGLVQLPYCPALADDVYRAYVTWCIRRGHKMPEAQNRFTPAFMSMNGVRRKDERVPDPDKIAEAHLKKHQMKKRRVFLMGEQLKVLQPGAEIADTCIDTDEWLVKGITAFRRALRAYESEDGGSRGGARAQQDAAL